MQSRSKLCVADIHASTFVIPEGTIEYITTQEKVDHIGLHAEKNTKSKRSMQ